MSVESMIRKIQRRIRELEKRSKQSTIYESFDGEFPPNHTGLVIIYPEINPSTLKSV